jgi:competence protein ComEC
LLETAAGRLVPWLAIGFGLGIILYFSIDQEPATWAVLVLMLGTAGAGILLRRRPIGFPAAVAVAAIAAGFGCAAIKCRIIAHPVLTAPVWNVEIAGFVETREERERSDRITLRVERVSGARLNKKIERVRLAVRKGSAQRSAASSN